MAKITKLPAKDRVKEFDALCNKIIMEVFNSRINERPFISSPVIKAIEKIFLLLHLFGDNLKDSKFYETFKVIEEENFDTAGVESFGDDLWIICRMDYWPIEEINIKKTKINLAKFSENFVKDEE